ELTEETLAELNSRFETASASEIVEWAVACFHPHMCLTASMTDAVLVDIATQVEPSVEVVFIDTGYHFPETLQTLETVRRQYGLNLRILTAPRTPVPLWQSSPSNCCGVNKVAQLERALAGKLAWMSGLRRQEASTRRRASIISRDRRGLVKVNPLATWTDFDVAGYIADHGVPVNPLVNRGYISIGCLPCTRAVAPGEDNRAGRWSGTGKTECGLHDEVDPGHGARNVIA
ncbi:MAG TPA: phosphoadenylyl-sulfate reductase, partial [Acidimicrobiales bacterium]|nr:phosphoadenylyl-sulfate reductase [Acidimicrobiales bacterium]